MSELGEGDATIDGGMCAYEVIESSANTCQGEEFGDGEVSYDEDEDVRWQGEKEEHDTQNYLAAAAHLLILKVNTGPVFSTRLARVPSHTQTLFLTSLSSREHAQRCAHIISR